MQLGIHSKAIADRRRVDEDDVIDQAGMAVKHDRARQRRAAVVAHGEHIVRFDQRGWDIRFAAIEGEVSVGDELTRLCPRIGKAEAIDSPTPRGLPASAPSKAKSASARRAHPSSSCITACSRSCVHSEGFAAMG